MRFAFDRRMKRRLIAVGSAAIIAASVLGAMVVTHGPSSDSGIVHAAPGTVPFCKVRPQLCTETQNPWTYAGQYTGHDEPSVLFYSNTPGSGDTSLYNLTLPKDPPTPPNQAGTGGTWNFQLHPAFWFGMAMCDTQSAPTPNKACPADSDSNIYTSLNPSSPNYIGNTPGTAFMEMQFYPPGWDPVSCTPDDTQWCAALNIDSFQENSNTGIFNNNACLNEVGVEPVNYAVITHSGRSEAPANPFVPFGEKAITTKDTLEMNAGDQITVNMHDSPAGFRVDINDLTTGQHGSMTASIANGFGHALYQPGASTCTGRLYAYHPMFSTSRHDTRVLWAAHTYNVAYSDEIGHFEYCNTADPSTLNCTAAGVTDPGGLDSDDSFCFTSGPQVLTGCVNTDNDFDGPEYQHNWPGSIPNVKKDQAIHALPVAFTSPTFAGPGGVRQNYSQVAFETDLGRIEGSDVSTNNDCQRHVFNPRDPSPGQGCVDPPNGASFYPFYSTVNVGGVCYWEEGDAFLPNTISRFGGSPTAEYGGLLVNIYPEAGHTVSGIYETFHRDLSNNPCPAPLG